MSYISIAIDGPAGAGKSTIAKMVSKELGIIYLDTGAMYRAIGFKALLEGIDTLDTEKIKTFLQDVDLKVIYDNGEQKILLNDDDITSKIRTPQVSVAASDVARIPEVRIKLVEIQREIAKNNDIVMDGRDIGTYVLPNATLKLFLTASIEERAKRRFKELSDKGETAILEDVIKDMEYRDKNDSTRDFAPLLKADDAHLLDTTNLSIDETILNITKMVKDRKW